MKHTEPDERTRMIQMDRLVMKTQNMADTFLRFSSLVEEADSNAIDMLDNERTKLLEDFASWWLQTSISIDMVIIWLHPEAGPQSDDTPEDF